MNLISLFHKTLSEQEKLGLENTKKIPNKKPTREKLASVFCLTLKIFLECQGIDRCRRRGSWRRF